MDIETPLRLPEAFETGIPSVDAEHRDLVATLNGCLRAHDGENISNFENRLGRFIAELRLHFVNEEMLMKDAGYPGLEKHARHHQAWIEELRGLLDRLRERGAADQKDVVAFFQRLIADVSKADIKFVEYLWSHDKFDDFKDR
ncbi:MAG: hemerythrin family protein [Rhodospirillales bacterium]|nr:hemerythrin family protein [Rhodospirillales bacterium]MBO6788715.1 hemerythrin family protein [Rhodospirillales bacterium]